MLELPIIVALAIVQSVYGVGLLVFGTPTFLILGYSYFEALTLLIPCSLTISIIQLASNTRYVRDLKLSIPLITVPSIFLGIMLHSTGLITDSVRYIVALTLILSSLTYFSETLSHWMNIVSQKHERIFLAATGLVHGSSNLGGGLLTTFVSNRYKSKEKIRANVAYGYIIFSTSQAFGLSMISQFSIPDFSLLNSTVCLIVYLLTNIYIFSKITTAMFMKTVPILCLIYGVVLFL